MKPLHSSILIILFIILGTSCKLTPKGARPDEIEPAQDGDSARDLGKDSDDDSGDDFWGKDKDDKSFEALSYNNGIKAIVQNSCVSCHGNDSNSVYPNLSTYDLLKFSAQRSVTYIDSGLMPKEPETMSDEDKEKFRSWVEGGMKEGNDSESSSDFGGSSIAYSDLSRIIENACGSCHTSSQTYPPLGTEANLKENGQAAVSSVEAGRMPPQSSGKSISTSDLNKLKKWLQDSN